MNRYYVTVGFSVYADDEEAAHEAALQLVSAEPAEVTNVERTD